MYNILSIGMASVFVTPRFPSGQATYVRRTSRVMYSDLDKLNAIKHVIYLGISYRMHLDRPVGTVFGNSRARFSAESSDEASAAVPIGCIWTVHWEPYGKSRACPREALAKARLGSTGESVPSSSSAATAPCLPRSASQG